MVGRPFGRSGSGRDTLPVVRNWSGDPPECPELVGTHSWRSGTGWETLSMVPELVGRPSQRSGSGRVAIFKVRKRLGDPHGGLKVV